MMKQIWITLDKFPYLVVIYDHIEHSVKPKLKGSDVVERNILLKRPPESAQEAKQFGGVGCIAYRTIKWEKETFQGGRRKEPGISYESEWDEGRSVN